MLTIKISEAIAARRRIPVYLVDATDGYTPKTGITAPTVEVSKAGAAQAAGVGTWTEIGEGQYYYEVTAGEVDTLGFLALSIRKTGCRDVAALAQVVAFDPYDAIRLGLTALPNAASSDPGGLATLIAAADASADQATTAAGEAATAAGAAQTAAEAAQTAAEAANDKLTAARLGVLDALDITVPDTGIPTLAFFTNAPGGTADAPTVPHQGPYNLTLEDPSVRVIELAVDSAVTLRFVLRNAFGQPMDLTAATGSITATLTDRNNAAVDDPIVCGERFLPDGIITVRLEGVYTATADRFHLSVRADFGTQILTWSDLTVVFS